jgi:multicomponent Na+:H+ antiporter subunit E
MSIKWRSRLTVYILSLLIWFALTDIKKFEEVAAGIVISFLVSLIAGHMLVTTEKSKSPIMRFKSAVIYLFKFLWEMIKANIHVAYIVLHPNLPIKPGIVKIKTRLTKDIAITVLTNSITLTPGTLTIDVDKQAGEIYIHWIDTFTIDTDQATKEIGGKFEKNLVEVFE